VIIGLIILILAIAVILNTRSVIHLEKYVQLQMSLHDPDYVKQCLRDIRSQLSELIEETSISRFEVCNVKPVPKKASPKAAVNTLEQRRKTSERMKKFWAEKRKKEGRKTLHDSAKLKSAPLPVPEVQDG
jgi:hypothetical protein